MKNILIVIGVLFLIIAVLIFRPVPIVSEKNAVIEKGIVSDIYEGGVNDIVFRLENKKNCRITNWPPRPLLTNYIIGAKQYLKN